VTPLLQVLASAEAVIAELTASPAEQDAVLRGTALRVYLAA